MKYTISVIVPIYNTAEYLPRCVESLLAQDYKNMEILLIDDCSTDESEKIGRTYADQYERIRFFRQTQNQGQSAARNRGIAEASGEWVAFVDSDDWVASNYISSMVEKIISEDAVVVINTMRVLVKENGQKKTLDYAASLSSDSSHARKVALLPFGTCQKLVRRDMFQDCLFPEQIHRFEEFGTFVPIFTKTHLISVIHKPTYFYFQRNNSVSTSIAERNGLDCFGAAVICALNRSRDGFKRELDFRIINDCLYGLTSNMIRAQFKGWEIKEEIEKMVSYVSDWRHNPYRRQIPMTKRIFLFFAYRKWIMPLPNLVWAWDHIGKWLR